MATVKVGVIGIGGMGGVHLGAYSNNPQAEVVAICDIDPAKLEGSGNTEFNLGSGDNTLDLTNLKKYSSYEDLINDPEIALVDICLPTPLHAKVTILALEAGKDVFCEKPMAFSLEEADAMKAALDKSGKQLCIGHCLRYWPEYVEAHKALTSGKYGKPLYARYHRTSGTPWWSWNDWLRTGSQSGGVVLDMHVHDVDTAVWWFGKPDSITADGIIIDDLPVSVDSIWRYNSGLVVTLHSAWDNNGGPFRQAFKLVMEKATFVFDMTTGKTQIIEGGKEETTTEIEVSTDSAYHLEIADFVAHVAEGRKFERITPEGSRDSLEVVLEELRQIKEKNA